MNALSYCLTLALATISIVAFGVDLYMNYGFTMNKNNNNNNGNNNSTSNGYSMSSFYKNTKEMQFSKQHLTQITPSYWIFATWDVIYILLAVWYIFVFYLLLFRQLCCGRNKSPLFPGIFWFLLIVVHVLNGLWVYLFEKNNFVISGIIILILTFLLFLVNMIASRVCWLDVTYDKTNNDDNDVERCNDDDIVELSRCEIVLLRSLTLNGLPLYAIWCSVASAIQWAIIFQYFTFHWSAGLASVVPLAVLSVVLLIYWFVELILQRQFFVYTWLTAISLILSFGAIIQRYHSIGDANHPGLFFAFILLIVSGAMMLFKFLTLCCCPPKYDNPRFSHI